MAEVIVDRLVKTYGNASMPAVHDVSFAVERGELFGLIGPDGAGKTTIFRILTTLLLPDAGQATVLGEDVVRDYRSLRRRIGYMPGKFSLYQDLSVEENLTFFATLFGTTVEANYAIIRDIYVQLEPFKDRRAGKLSGGMKQKLALCCALVHRPDVLILDEPTTGVDAVSRKEFWQILHTLKQQGMTILVSTPYMDEATLCDRIALMQHGSVLSLDTPDGIISQFPYTLFAISSDRMGPLLRHLREAGMLEKQYAFGEKHHIVFAGDDTNALRASLLDELSAKGHRDLVCEQVRPTVEDCFIHFLS